MIQLFNINHHKIDTSEFTNLLHDDIVLEFDLVRGEKRGNVSDMSHQSFSIKTIQLEIEKCEIRCANCHRIATYERRLDKKNISQVIEKIQKELVSNQLSMSFG